MEGQMFTRIFALAIAMASATAAYGTPRDVYEKLWSKRAITDTGNHTAWQKPKAACVCMDGLQNGELGALARNSASQASCAMPVFDGNGTVVILNFCYTFEYIGK